MATHDTHHPPAGDETLELSGRASGLAVGLLVVGVIGVLAALGLSLATEGGIRRFYHAYLTNYAYFLSIALGGLFFVLIHHVTRAAWSTCIRRIAEAIAATLPFMGLLAIPLAVAVWSGKGQLYPWAMPKPEHPAMGSTERAETLDKLGPAALTTGSAAHQPGDASHAAPPAETGSATGHSLEKGITPLTMGKLVFLNPGFWTARVVFYFVVWSLIALWYWKSSRAQDQSGDVAISNRLAVRAAPLIVVYGLTVTFAAFDLIMSTDPDWYSTMFGVYYFAGCAGGMFATVILTAALLQNQGYMRQSLTTEHYHDLGKWLFAFTFFWGYIAFSQYMLIWYGNIPEETYWYQNRGATTNPEALRSVWGWSIIALMLLFGRLIIPFGGLLSRHVKRNRPALVFWAIWILVFHWIDQLWLVMPEYSRAFTLGLPELLCLVGIGGIFVGSMIWRLSAAPLRPLQDPRLPEAMALQNF